MWKCAPLPVRFENGLGMKVAIMPCLRAISLAAIFTNVKLSADFKRIRIGEVHFELAVRVLVVDLVDVDAHARKDSVMSSSTALVRDSPL